MIKRMRAEYDFIDGKKNQYFKNEVIKFLETHRDIEFSAAKFAYTLYLYGEAGQEIIKLANTMHTKAVTDMELEKVITETTKSSDLLNLMRKKLSASNSSLLREKIMIYEDTLMPMIKEKCIHNKQDIFIENAAYFFMTSKVDCCEWIMEMYPQFESEYLKSMLCLVLGFRGEVNMIPFLMKEAERMENEYPRETFDQGPALAVQELAVRHGLN